ncbi:MAG TPA: (deoxy)nucleoside triphosphate pyrophosphohydrolase [Candidatus Binatia bacterium]|jgi:8-oxo-dGTP diphosphatase|nr:(deoxy)nucleoside triphosphate pyrophosphohydrolase [Candidatus Binatia bacterium]
MTAIIRVSAGVLTRGRQLLICQRRVEDPHPLKWEFPGGKALEGEDEAACLQRELREELVIEATIGMELLRTAHTYPNGRTVALTFFHVPTYSGEIKNTQFHAVTWVEPAQLPAYDFLEGDVAFVSALARGGWAYIFSNP